MGKKKRHEKQPETKTKHEEAHEPWGVILIRWLAIVASFAALLYPRSHATIIGFAKVMGFEIVTGMMLAIWIGLMWADKRYRPNWRSPLVIGPTVFVAALAVTVPFSVDPFHSFWSDVYRQTGLFNYAHYWLWFLMLSSTQQGRVAWQKLLGGWNIAAMTVAAYGIVRALSDGTTGRMESSLGNALYLSIYCLISIVIAAILLARAQDWTKRAYYGFSLITLTAILLFTGSRSSVLGLGMFVLSGAAIMLAANRFSWKKSKIPFVILGATAVAGIAWLGLRTDAGAPITEKLPYGMQRIVKIEGAGIDRAVLGEVAISMFRERPVFGWGLDMFEHGFEKNYDPTTTTGMLTEPWYDRAHNQFLDFLAMGGLFGFVGYLILWGSVLLTGISLLRRKPEGERLPYAVALAGLIGYATNVFFAFDLLAVLPLVWGVMAFLASREPDPDAIPVDEPEHLVHVTLGLMIVFLIFESMINIKPFIAAKKVDWACKNVGKNPEKALAVAQDALKSFNAITPEIRFRTIDCFGQVVAKVGTPEWRLETVRMMASESDRGAQAKPYDFKTRMINAFSYSLLAQAEHDKTDRARQIINEAREMQPNRYRTEMVAAQIEKDAGDHAKAAYYYQQAVNLCPNSTVRQEITPLLIARLASAGQTEEAVKVLVQGYKSGEPPLPNPQTATELQKALTGDYAVGPELADWLKQTASTYPSPSAYAALYKILAGSTNPNQQDLLQIELLLRTNYPELAQQMGM